MTALAPSSPKRTGSCSECNKALYHAAAKTCGKSCRSKRARRIKRAQTRGGQHSYPEHQKYLADMDDLAHEVVKEELRPVVREAITADVLRAAGRLVGLTPRLVECIEEDLNSTDKVLRQRAYTLLAKFTLGNPSVAPQPEAPEAQPMQVVFALPRPLDDHTTNRLPEAPAALALPRPATATAPLGLRECVECQANKLPADFVDGSARCQTCHDLVIEQVAARFA